MAQAPTPLEIRTVDAPGLGRATTPLNTFIRQVTQGLTKGLTFGDNFNASVITVSPVAIPSPWQSPTFLNSWVDVGDAGLPVGYMKLNNGMVVIRGRVKSGTVGGSTPVFNLPAAYLPPGNVVFTQDNNAPVTYRLFVSNTASPTGVSIVAGASTPGAGSAFSLSCSYMAADMTPVPNLASPITFAHGLKGRCKRVFIGHVTNLDGGLVITDAVTPNWVDDGQGSVVISSLPGLVPLGTYSVEFLCFGD